jgi:ATP-dependent Clp protease ATP-binding subunit ClpA
MFERFTDSARRAIVLSQGEARGLAADQVHPDHLLLGVLTADDATAGAVLASLGLDSSAVRSHAVARYGRAETDVPGLIRFSDSVKKSLEYSLRESSALNHSYIGSEHIVLGMISDPSEETADMLRAVGLEADALRDAIMTRLRTPTGSEPAEP